MQLIWRKVKPRDFPVPLVPGMAIALSTPFATEPALTKQQDSALPARVVRGSGFEKPSKFSEIFLETGSVENKVLMWAWG